MHCAPTTSQTTNFIDRRPPPHQRKWLAFKNFLWNKEKGTFCNRTVINWLHTLIFYLLFLTCVIGMALFLISSSSNYIRGNCGDRPCIEKPAFIYQASPGLSFEPNIIKAKSPLIWYGGNDWEHSTTDYINYITARLRKYKEMGNQKNYSGYSTETCSFNADDLGPCAKRPFGYEEKPCLYIKLNKQPQWKPDFYTQDNLPKYMPERLKNAIQKTANKNVLWLHCEGMSPADEEHLGSVTYYPIQGYRECYFPTDNFTLSPLVAVQLANVKRGFAISISCSIWARNVNNKDSKEYTTYIQFYIEMV